MAETPVPAASSLPADASPRDALETAVYFGGGALALLAAAVVLRWPAALPALFWGWLLLIDGPHLLATWLRIAGDPARRDEHAALRRRVRWVLALPLLAWGLALAWPAMRAMEGLMALGTLWSWHHLSRQHHGILCLLQARRDRGRPEAHAVAQRERRLLRHWLWGVFVLSALATPANRRLWQVGPQAEPAWNAAAGLVAAFVVGCIAWLLHCGLQRRRLGLSLQPWGFALLPAGAVSTLALLAIGWREPLYGAATRPEQVFMAVTLMTGLVHGTQYLAIVLRAHRARHLAAPSAGVLGGFARRPAAGLLALMAVSVFFYGALNASRGTLPGLAWGDPDGAAAQFAMALYWGAFFHHYQVDSLIWRLGQDAGLRREMGIG